MNEGDQCDLLKFFMIIMSSKTKEEEQREVLLYLQSNPNTLHTLIKHGLEKYYKELTSSRTDDRPHTSTATMDKDSGVGMCDTNAMLFERNLLQKGVNQKTNTSDEYLSTCITSSKGHGIPVLTQSSSPEMSDTIFHQSNQLQSSKKRKSKYSDIEGDLSHIHREPKCSQIDQNAMPKRKYTRRHQLDSARKETEECRPSPRKCDIFLVQRLIKMLMKPKSQEQQENIICLLKSDECLTKIFIDEKAKLGKTKIPVFKVRQCASDEGNQSTTSEQQKQTENSDDQQHFCPSIVDGSTYTPIYFMNTCTTATDINDVVCQNDDTSEKATARDYLVNLPTDNHNITYSATEGRTDSNPPLDEISPQPITFATHLEEVQEFTLL